MATHRIARCKHHRSWVVCGGWLTWCYQCGAIRQLRVEGDGAVAVGGWVCPTGPGGKNPYPSRFGAPARPKPKTGHEPHSQFSPQYLDSLIAAAIAKAEGRSE